MAVVADAGTATMSITAGGSGSDASITVTSGSGNKAKLSLVEGSSTFDIYNDGANDKLVIKDGAHELFTVAKTTGVDTARGFDGRRQLHRRPEDYDDSGPRLQQRSHNAHQVEQWRSWCTVQSNVAARTA